VLVSIRNPEFPEFFFIHEHFQRFVSKGHRREGPLWYFLPLLLAGFLPWTSWVVQGVAKGVLRLKRRPTAFKTKATGLLTLWSLFILFFFSISSSKLPGYIMPIYPALAMLAAPIIASQRARTVRWHVLGVLGLSATLAIVLWFIYPQEIKKDLYYQALYAEYAQILVGCMALLALGCGISLYWLRRPRIGHWLAVGTLAVTGLVTAHGMLLGHQVLSPSSSAVQMTKTLEGYIEKTTPLYCVDIFEHGLLFYTQRTCTLVVTKDEMYHGVEQEPHKHIPDLATFAQRWQADAKAIALVQPGRVDELKQLGLPFKEVFRDGRRVLVVKPAP
jgi:4-amino-4-deoxy-L-arabinose transferase-like glycosyltransferase